MNKHAYYILRFLPGCTVARKGKTIIFEFSEDLELSL